MKTGRQSFRAERPVYVRSSYTVVGPKEGDGAFGALFDTVLSDDLWGERSYEKAESKMHREAVRGAMCLAGEERDGVDLMLAGDLLNELSASGFAMRYFKVPFAGLYNACSTFSEGMLIGTALISGSAADTVACSTSSHFASAERQYRYPLELGNQRTPTSQWTVTGAGCTVLGARRPTAEEDARNRRDFAERMRNMREECLKREGEGDGKCDPFCKNGVFSGFARRIKAKLRPQTLQEPVADENYRRTHVIRISGGTFGKVVDFGIDDESNMGGAMAAGCGRHPHRAFRGYGHLALRLRRHIHGRPRQVRKRSVRSSAFAGGRVPRRQASGLRRGVLSAASEDLSGRFGCGVREHGVQRDDRKGT